MNNISIVEKEIHELFENLKLAWNNGDGDLYASFFTDDCDYIAFNGQHIKGRTANAKLHNDLFRGFLKKSKLTGKIISIKPLSDNVVIFYAIGAVQLRFQKNEPKKRLSINTNVVVKSEGSWKIASFQNTRIQGPNIFQRLFALFSKS